MSLILVKTMNNISIQFIALAGAKVGHVLNSTSLPFGVSVTQRCNYYSYYLI